MPESEDSYDYDWEADIDYAPQSVLPSMTATGGRDQLQRKDQQKSPGIDAQKPSAAHFESLLGLFQGNYINGSAMSFFDSDPNLGHAVCNAGSEDIISCLEEEPLNNKEMELIFDHAELSITTPCSPASSEIKLTPLRLPTKRTFTDAGISDAPSPIEVALLHLQQELSPQNVCIRCKALRIKVRGAIILNREENTEHCY